jgi:hypothetical protein
MMRIALRHQAGLVPEQALHLVEIHVSLHEPRGEGVPHVMEAEVRNPHAVAGSLTEINGAVMMVHPPWASKIETTIPRRQGKGNYADVRSCIQL